MNTMTVNNTQTRPTNLELLEGTASYENTTANTIHKIAKDAVKSEGSSYLLWCISVNKDTSAETLELLFEHGKVLHGVAGNPNTPVSILEVLATNKGFSVRMGTAGNPNTPVSILEVLATDDEDLVRTRVAMNTSTPKHLLEVLVTDHYDNVSWYAQEQLNKR